jgi:hypothetical protein
MIETREPWGRVLDKPAIGYLEREWSMADNHNLVPGVTPPLLQDALAHKSPPPAPTTNLALPRMALAAVYTVVIGASNSVLWYRALTYGAR